MSKKIPEDEAAKQSRGELRTKLTAHRGLATWGERLVPLADFRRAAESAGRTLGPEARAAAHRSFLELPEDPTPVEGPFSRIAVFGGVYNNSFALEALLEEVTRRGAEAVYCLGDLGGFGPHPDRIRPLLEQGAVRVIQGNYEESLAAGRHDCNCGYTDPRDNHFAKLSYGYTERYTSDEFKRWMGSLPRRRRLSVADRELLLVHGSPRQVNEFLFESTTPVPFLERMLEREAADAVLCSHTGLDWHRRLPSGGDAVNVGVIGRPANDGSTDVRFCWIENRDGDLSIELARLEYDHQGLAGEMRRENLPEAFVDTILSGWWTTCLEILPARERSLSRH